MALNRINERSNLEINDVLFSGTGTIGRVSLVEEEPKNWNVKEGVYILKPNLQKVNPVYLMYLMRSNYIIINFSISNFSYSNIICICIRSI